MAKKGQTLQRLWNKYKRYCENTCDGRQAYSYRQYCKKYQDYLATKGMLRCTIDEWLDVNTRMVHFFGGVTPIITPDNAKVAVTSNNDYADPVLNKDYNEWA